MKKNVLDWYRELRATDESYIYAMPGVETFTFYMRDAHRIHDALPDVPIQKNRVEEIVVHKLAFFPLAARLKAKGVKVALVARELDKDGNFRYWVESRSDD